MSSMVMNWLTENFCAVLADVIGGFLDVFGDVVNNIFYWIIQVATEKVDVINAGRSKKYHCRIFSGNGL